MKRLFNPSATFASYLATAILVLVPFHAFLTVWFSSFLGHYTLLRLWDDAVLGVLLCLVWCWLLRDKALWHWLGQKLVFRLILAYAALTLLLGAVSLLKGDVTLKACAYGVLINLRFLAWFLAVLLVVRRSSYLQQTWPRMLLIPAAAVVLFAVLQYTVLPHNFLSHFGYNAATTIAPIETINHNRHYIRVASTLRGANPLGAYSVIIVAAAAAFGLRKGARKWAWTVFGLVTIITLYASGSRSAWIGSLLAAAILSWHRFKDGKSRKILLSALAVLVLAVATVALLLRNNTGLQNALLHTQRHSAVATGSNSAHASALRSGISDVLHQPLGDGPGTAGPASTYNSGVQPRIAENYYVQIAQETGWLGLALFIAIIVLVARELYHVQTQSRLALVLFASFMGLAFVNLLSHAWADDTLAFVWWGMAGIALGWQHKEPASA